MGLEKLCVEWKEFGVEQLFYSRKVNFRVFRVRMVAVNQQRRKSQDQQKNQVLTLQKSSPAD